jgi:hypothetical protein
MSTRHTLNQTILERVVWFAEWSTDDRKEGHSTTHPPGPLNKTPTHSDTKQHTLSEQAVHELNLTCVVPEIVEVHKPVHYDREVLFLFFLIYSLALLVLPPSDVSASWSNTAPATGAPVCPNPPQRKKNVNF